MPYTPPIKTFNQSLNTSDSVTFDSENLTGTLNFGYRLGTLIRYLFNGGTDYYTCGIQYGTLYHRTDIGFAWFKGGVHHDDQYNPGANGSTLATLDSNSFTCYAKGLFIAPANVFLSNFAQLELRGTTTDQHALISFHRPGAYGAHFGLDGSNDLIAQSWHLVNNVYLNLKAGNITANHSSAGQGSNIGLHKRPGSLPGYPNDSYPTLKTDHTHLYFAVNGVYAGHMNQGGVLTQVSTFYQKKVINDRLDLNEVLDTISYLPIDIWEYEDEPGVRHLGTYAEAFYLGFKLNGEIVNDSPIQPQKTIAPLDLAGVALAGVKGLYEKIKEQQAQITLLNIAVRQLLDKLH